jgi:hypothetical protein
LQQYLAMKIMVKRLMPEKMPSPEPRLSPILPKIELRKLPAASAPTPPPPYPLPVLMSGSRSERQSFTRLCSHCQSTGNTDTSTGNTDTHTDCVSAGRQG